ncbi:MAG: hypothetical protein Q8R61_06575 [Thiobacillus sp.]|uniref:hypothetical protein n=1 Tax=Thiobacillus sp. TaxID=924 RepID=UPI0027338350|nr:hypothetical protein [Thiobacillus sp.]MDP3584769.1 hypothetical protein [Thiobacillus sp.]
MKKMMRLPLAGLVLAFGSTATAGDFDGSRPLVCAPVEAMDCIAGGGCEKGIPDDVGAPAFMRIDFAKKVIIGPKHSSPINAMEKEPHQILLQGTELGLAWSMALDTANGKMVITFSSRDGAYVLFGSCTPL